MSKAATQPTTAAKNPRVVSPVLQQTDTSSKDFRLEANFKPMVMLGLPKRHTSQYKHLSGHYDQELKAELTELPYA